MKCLFFVYSFLLSVFFNLVNSQFQNYINSIPSYNINSSWPCSNIIQNNVNGSDYCANFNKNSTSNWTCCYFNSTSVINPVNFSYTGNAFCLPIMKSQITNLSNIIGNQNVIGNTTISYFTQNCHSKFRILRKIVFLVIVLIFI